MKKSKGRFNRSMNTKEYRKVFNIFMEGRKTEPAYFGLLKQQCNEVSLLLHTPTTRTDPRQILGRAKKHAKKNPLGKNEEIWIVVDVDKREKDTFISLFEWDDESKKHGVAISNPSFEYWLLLHYDTGDAIQSLNDCINRLRQHLPNYKKNNLNLNQIEIHNIERAISNAMKRHQYCHDWHVDNYSTVYLLVDKIIEETKN